MQPTKEYSVRVTLYHKFTVEAASQEEATEIACQELWDDHVKDCIIDIEETD
jgi:hypothetical protein